MKFKKFFTIIELLTVILVILTLMSLLIPVFSNLKMNARTAICKSQLRQVSTLITSYMSDYNGYLPYKNASIVDDYHRPSDIPRPTTGNNELYQFWNGHLLPYFHDLNLPDKYTRYAIVTKKEVTRFDTAQFGSAPNPPPDNVLKNGWVVVDDAYQKGGYNDLRAFICPEIHQNCADIKVKILFNGIKIPRISQLCTRYEAFDETAGWPTMFH